jgi:hypothetical protein
MLFLLESLKGRGCLEDIESTDGRIILKFIVRK